MKLLIISDLHIGTEARSNDLCPHDLGPEGSIGRENGFIEKFLSHIDANQEAFQDTTALIITGDISNRAHPKEFQLANEVFERIAKHLNISFSRIFFVPGNHDVHWPVMKLDPPNYWRAHRYSPLQDQSGLLINRINDSHHGSLIDSPFFSVWVESDLHVIAINTASHDDPKEAVHHGLVAQDTIDALKDHLNKSADLKNKLKICLMHHHPLIYSETNPEYPDFSTAVNSENLMNLLCEHNIDLVIHGHKHNPRINYRVNNNSQPHLVVGAGSFSAHLDPVSFTGIPNTFHLLEIAGRDNATNGIHGLFTTWAYEGGGAWGGNVGKNIPHVEQFGTTATAQEIKEAIKGFAAGRLLDRGFIKWKELTESNPTLQRISKKSAHTAMIQAALELQVEFNGSMTSPLSSWLLVKE